MCYLVKFKGLEGRNPPEDVEPTPDPTDVESLRFGRNDIKSLHILDTNGELTDKEISTEIFNLFEDKDKYVDSKENELDHESKIDDNYLFSVGLIADPQYADTASRFNYAKTRIRRYRNALNITTKAVEKWNEDKPLLMICLGDIIDGLNKTAKTSRKCMQDILNEFDQFKLSKDTSAELIQNILKFPLNEHENALPDIDNDYDRISSTQFPFFHNLIGNHELYNFDRRQLMQYFHSPSSKEMQQNWDCHQCGLTNSRFITECKACFAVKGGKDENDEIMTPRFYYSFSPFPGYVFIILNCYELSMMGYDYYDSERDGIYGLTAMDSSHFNLKQYKKVFEIKSDLDENKDTENSKMHPNKQIAIDLLKKYNDGNVYGIPYSVDDNQRWTMFNGGFGHTQLVWLENELKQIEAINESNKDNKDKMDYKVILFGHIQIWCNFGDKEVGLRGNERTLCWDYKEINEIIGKYKCVKMYVAGHKHGGECVKHPNGIWHRTLEGAIEADLDKDCFGTMYFYDDFAVLKGYGIDSGTFDFR